MTDQELKTAPAELENDVREEDLAHEDDSIIGKAFRWSLVAFAGIAATIGGIVWILSRPEPPAPVIETTFVAPKSIAADAQFPLVEFTDMTRASGVDFVHQNGATGDKLLPESMGAGVAFLDVDGDGDSDLLFTNGNYWPGGAPEGAAPPTPGLYRNDGTGKFENITEGSGLDISLYGMGIAVGDIDNDGDPDVYLTAVGENHLFRNEGGRFVDITAAAGVAGPATEWSTSAGFVDYDRDGKLDLFVCNYVHWSKEIDFAVDYRLVGVGRAYGPPMNFEGTHCALYHNEGDGRFRDVSADAGIQVVNSATGRPMAKALALTFCDIGNDGWPDIFVANDTVANFLFRNKGDGTFQEVAAETGVAYDNMGSATGAMGIDAGDIRNEGTLGIGIGNFANEMTSLYAADEDPWMFTDVAIAEGVGAPSRKALTFGLFFFDYDLDGRLDLFQTNGHLEDEINRVQPSQHYRQPSQLFWNCGPKHKTCFMEVDGDTTGALATPIVGRGSAYGDIDGDGDLDVVITQVATAPLILRNDVALSHHWLRVRLNGGARNRDAIGARIELTVAGTTQQRTVNPTRSYLSQSERVVTFGLGDQKSADQMRIVWPDGQVDEYGTVAGDQLLTYEPKTELAWR